jgi:4-hydroxy-2-oxoheptanedioate aldolase
MGLERARKLKERVKAGECASGLWLTIPSPVVAEIVADAGFDWVIVDAEHFPMNPDTLLAMLLCFRGSPTVPLIRLPWNDAVMVKQALDLGWEGVVLPQVNTPEEAARAVSACRYPPMGGRGFGPRRASGYFRNMQAYAEEADESLIAAIQIEDYRASERIEEIVRVPGVDWILLGPTDMSGSLGRLLDLEGDELWRHLRKIYRVAADHGIPTGSPWNGKDRLVEATRLGCRLLFLGDDTTLLRDSVDGLVAAFRKFTTGRPPARG